MKKGIILNAGGNFALEHGRIAVSADADLQTADLVIRANRGEFKEAPLIGGEVLKMQNGTPDPNWCLRVKKMLKSVGVRISSVSMNNEEIRVRL